MNLGIFEIDGNYPFVETMTKICHIEDTLVWVFTTEYVKEQIGEMENVVFVTKRSDEPSFWYLYRIQSTVDKLDLLFINTLGGRLEHFCNYLFFQPKCKTIVTIHNLNRWFNPKLQLKKSLKKLIDVNSMAVLRKLLLSRFEHINVIYEPLKYYVTWSGKQFYNFPYQLYEGNGKVGRNKQLTFVVPGRIDPARKDYNLVLSVFEPFLRIHKIKLVLLGNPIGDYGCDIIQRAEQLKKQGCDIEYFTSYVPFDVFKSYMQGCDFIFAPITLDFFHEESNEIYGRSKASGTPSDSFRYAKPIILPKGYVLSEDLEKVTIQYEDENDLSDSIHSLISNRKRINEYKRNALDVAQKYSLEHYQSYLKDVVLKEMN